jgi:CcmD family protein
MIYLFLAYFMMWVLTFAYIFTLASRSKRLEREVQLLRREAAEPVNTRHTD